MHFILRHKYIISLGILCLLSSLFYTQFNNPTLSPENFLSFTESSKKNPPQSLKKLTLKKQDPWRLYPIEGDLFTTNSSLNGTALSHKENSNNLSDSSNESLNPLNSSSIQLDAWANIRGEMVFVLSDETLQTSFVGRVGDSFENPTFTILSYDFQYLESYSNKYPCPLVTILNKEMNEKIILTPTNSIPKLF
ncbi:hypothetical protein AYO37_00510 [Opitutia bacterium SCGC AG-212-L18]|nr:hypothetical protein AYO37_00510 [Opitutae bacterium SCGC AG-212-L18]